jgi:hypothetical protein
MIVLVTSGMNEVMASIATPSRNATVTRRQNGRIRPTMRRNVPRARPSGGGSVPYQRSGKLQVFEDGLPAVQRTAAPRQSATGHPQAQGGFGRRVVRRLRLVHR